MKGGLFSRTVRVTDDAAISVIETPLGSFQILGTRLESDTAVATRGLLLSKEAVSVLSLILNDLLKAEGRG